MLSQRRLKYGLWGGIIAALSQVGVLGVAYWWWWYCNAVSNTGCQGILIFLASLYLSPAFLLMELVRNLLPTTVVSLASYGVLITYVVVSFIAGVRIGLWYEKRAIRSQRPLSG